MPHSRMDRVTALIQQELASLVDQELRNPELPEFITIHSVKVTKDLRAAQVFYTLLNDESQDTIDKTTAELNKSAGFLRRELGRRVTLRNIPALHFHYNPSTRYAAGLEHLFIKIEDEPPGPAVAAVQDDATDAGE